MHVRWRRFPLRVEVHPKNLRHIWRSGFDCRCCLDCSKQAKAQAQSWQSLQLSQVFHKYRCVFEAYTTPTTAHFIAYMDEGTVLYSARELFQARTISACVLEGHSAAAPTIHREDAPTRIVMHRGVSSCRTAARYPTSLQRSCYGQGGRSHRAPRCCVLHHCSPPIRVTS